MEERDFEDLSPEETEYWYREDEEDKMDIQNDIMELSLMSYRAGLICGKYGGKAAIPDKEKVKKMREKLLDRIASKPSVQADAEKPACTCIKNINCPVHSKFRPA